MSDNTLPLTVEEIERLRHDAERGVDGSPAEVIALCDMALATARREEAAKDGNRPLPYDRDTLGRMVREAWVRWAETQPNPKPSWLAPYDDLSEPDKEADRQIGAAIARWTLIGDAAGHAVVPELPEGEVEGLIKRAKKRARLQAYYSGQPEESYLEWKLAAALAHQQAEIAAYRKAYGCIACGEDHPEGTMCPPFEVRTTGMSWNRGRLSNAVARAERAEANLASERAAREKAEGDLKVMADERRQMLDELGGAYEDNEGYREQIGNLYRVCNEKAVLACRLATLKRVVEPFAAEADRLDPDGPDPSIGDSCQLWQCGSEEFRRTKITYGDLRLARQALTAAKGEGEAK